jgi:dTDP-4-amino-4,6-dideoxygalactose transaminase
LVEAAITPRTKAIVPVHYAGVACDMQALTDVASRHGLALIEDAAQGAMATWDDRPLGTIGDLGALSFHETKNITCGEGGALLVNRAAHLERAEVLREKGTNRSRFMRGQVDKYTWIDQGSSYGLSDINAAFLWAQLEHATQITDLRLNVWRRYHEAFAALEDKGVVRRPVVPGRCRHNAHMYYLLLANAEARDAFLEAARGDGVDCVFHYVPLHSSPAGLRYARSAAPLPITEDLSARLVRLPIWAGMTPVMVDRVVSVAHCALESASITSALPA